MLLLSIRLYSASTSDLNTSELRPISSPSKQLIYLNRVVMSFFDLNDCLAVEGFLGWDFMIEEGWLVFNFEKNRKEIQRSKSMSQ